MILYVAGPYRGDIDANIARARQVSIAVWQAGHVALTPHLNTAHFEVDSGLSEERYLAGDLLLLACCDGVVLTPEWERSSGTLKEVEFAKANGMPIWVYPDLPANA